jgi:hypothetical protein
MTTLRTISVAGRAHGRTPAVLAAAGACACALAAAFAAPAEARISPGAGVAGVALGDTQAQVRAALGKPEAGSNPLNYRYIRSRGLGIYFIAGRVFEITVVRGPQATPKGIRVGSPVAALRRAHSKARCRPAVTGGRGALECALRGRHRGRTSETLFVTRAGRVASIAVHFV